MEIFKTKVAVILGAGASLGSSDGSAIRSSDWKPPLAQDLLGSRSYEPPFWDKLAFYPGAKTIQDLMIRDAKIAAQMNEEFAFEAALRHYAEHPHYAEHFKHVPGYLRDLIREVEDRWAVARPYYTQLVDQLLVRSEHQIAFISLNYDTFLEQAMMSVDPGLRIRTLNDYASDGKRALLFKVHGSVDWYTLIGKPDESWDRAVRSIEYPDVLRQDIGIEDHYVGPIRDYQDPDTRQRKYPLLTAPLAGKQDSEFLLPPKHEDLLAEFLSDCQKYLIIGTSGNDDDLLRFLRKHAARPSNIHYVGKGLESEVDPIRNRFETVPKFKAARMNSQIFWEGFGPYIDSREFELFRDSEVGV